MTETNQAVVEAQGSFRASDGCRLHSYHWRSPASDASAGAVVVVMHGYAEHAGRYRELAEYLVRAGHPVHAIDARGHGQSPGQRGHIERYETYVDDLYGYLQSVRSHDSARPLVLLGHSNGGLISLRTLQCWPVIIDGLILSSPMVCLQSKHRVPGIVASVLSKLVGRLPVPNGLKRSELTHDPEIIEAHRLDKLNHSWSTPRWYATATAAMSRAFADVARLRLPVLVLEAERDPIVVPQEITRLYQGISSEDKELAIIGNAFHELLNELDRKDTFGRLTGWLAARWDKRVAA